MPTKIIKWNFYSLIGIIFLFSCSDNHAPVIEKFICDSDSVKKGTSAIFEVIITDADNDATSCYWFFNGKRIPEYDRKTKITWMAPNAASSVLIKVEADDGTDDAFLDKMITVY